MAGRVGFIVANEVGRNAIDLALASNTVTPRQLRVFLAVVRATLLWSQLEDRLTLAQIAETAGITGKDTRDIEKRVASDLRALERLGVVTYQPGRGRRISTVGIPANGVETNPVTTGSAPTPGTGSKPTPQRGRNRPRTQEEVQETSPKKGRQSSPTLPDGSDFRGHPGGVIGL